MDKGKGGNKHYFSNGSSIFARMTGKSRYFVMCINRFCVRCCRNNLDQQYYQWPVIFGYLTLRLVVSVGIMDGHSLSIQSSLQYNLSPFTVSLPSISSPQV